VTKEDNAVSEEPAERTDDASEKWTAQEKAAMRERAKEMKAASGKGAKADPEAEVLAKIAEMPEPDRSIGGRIHDIIRTTAPDLKPRLWYGMPAYSKDGKVLCFFQAASKFDSRYASLGFNDTASLDSGAMWPTVFAVAELTEAEEKKISALVKKAAR
jgi:uncharacterized protein YdhG (YjbR/CyaY superfamily)